MNRIAQLETIERFIKPLLESMGYHLAERDFAFEGGRLILRIYIDKDGGVTVDDCAEVSRAVSARLDVEDPIPSTYDLEVSSPGVERPLRYPEDFSRYAGKTIKLKTVVPLNGRQNYRGMLKGCDIENIYLTVDGKDFAIPFAALARARIIKDWSQPE